MNRMIRVIAFPILAAALTCLPTLARDHPDQDRHDQVVEYLRNSHAVGEPTIQKETERYISSPGQACSYKLGHLKIRELRERAMFDITYCPCFASNSFTFKSDDYFGSSGKASFWICSRT